MIIKRTFEALKYPKGSYQRIKCNDDIVKSEYLQSYKYARIGNNYAVVYKTKEEAQKAEAS